MLTGRMVYVQYMRLTHIFISLTNLRTQKKHTQNAHT